MLYAEARQVVISSLLQATEPVPLDVFKQDVAVPGVTLGELIADLAEEGLVVQLRGAPRGGAPLLVWAAAWEAESSRRIESLRGGLHQAIPAGSEAEVNPHCRASHVFNSFLLSRYSPPLEKRFLVLLQCSVRRPFSTSPSHAAVRRAIELAVGHDPARSSARCPVHVVVLASMVGPAPYELEDVYPVNVRAGGVKQMCLEAYADFRPLLADRVAAYLVRHGACYERIVAFADGRYGDVLADAAMLAKVTFPIFPRRDGIRVIRMAGSAPRPYWERYWIQLFLEIVSWLPAKEQDAARHRLAERGVVLG